MLINFLAPLVVILGAVAGWYRGLLRIAAAFGALLMGGLLAHPLSPLGGLFTGAVPLALRPVADTLITGTLLVLILMIAAEVAIHRAEKKRQEAGEAVRPQWMSVAGAVVGGGWSVCFLILILAGLDAVGNATAVVTENVTAPSTLIVLQDETRQSVFAPVVSSINPLNERARDSLKDLMYVSHHPRLMAQFQANAQVQALMQDPHIVACSKDAEVQKAIRAEDYHTLLNNAQVADLLSDAPLFHQIQDANIPAIVHTLREQARDEEAEP